VFFSTTGGPEGGIFMMNANGSSVTRLISNDFANPGWRDYAVELPAWSPDGRTIAFVRYRCRWHPREVTRRSPVAMNPHVDNATAIESMRAAVQRAGYSFKL
jgi:Tol biopolymer transport system component